MRTTRITNSCSDRLYEIGFDLDEEMEIPVSTKKNGCTHNPFKLHTDVDSVNGRTVEEILLSLSTVSAVGNTGDWRLTAMPKNVRGILGVFGLEPLCRAR